MSGLLQQLDLGYREDQRAFARLTNAHWLRDNGIEDGSQIFGLARRLRPDDALVVQQEALSWRFRDPARAKELLLEASRLAPGNQAIEHSRAVLLADEARSGPAGERMVRFAEAEGRFRKLIARDSANSAPYVSLADLYLDRARESLDPTAQIQLLAEAEQAIVEAFRRAPLTFQLLGAAARVEAAAGDINGAEDDYRRAAAAAGPNPAVWLNLARFLDRHGKSTDALDALNYAIDLNPTHPGLNYELAGVAQRVPSPSDAVIRRAFEYAVAEPVRGYLPELDFAIYLHQAGDGARATEHFANLRALPLPYRVKAAPRKFVEENGERTRFPGVVSDLRFRSAYLAIPNHAVVYVDPGSLPAEARKVGATVTVTLAYNCFGLRAVVEGDEPAEGSDESDEPS